MSDDSPIYRPKRRPKQGHFVARNWKLLAAGAAVIGYAVIFVFGDSGIWDYHQLTELYDARAEQIAELEREKVSLKAYLTALNDKDEAALERAAREIGLVGPGERIYEIQVAAVK